MYQVVSKWSTNKTPIQYPGKHLIKIDPLENDNFEVEFLILVAKNDKLDDFQKDFFYEEKSFMLNHSDLWLENILTFYQDYGLPPFQSIKVSFPIFNQFRN